jgi:uncharacterized protein with PIN domain
MKILTDATLGRLVKWLRILGYDSAYLAGADHLTVIRLARAEDRLILTRDRSLIQRRGARMLLIRSELLEDQLLQVRDTIGLPPAAALPRCPVCNQILTEAQPQLIAARVPPYVRRTQKHFTVCVQCDRIYWRGTHWQRMERLISGLRDDSGSAKIEPDR